MKIFDTIYGEIVISEPVIIDIINSKPFQRLKGINQYGATVYLQPSRTTTRYDHSIGTWYLSKEYGRSIEEQIASLLHDVPHTAFSHVVDFVMNDKNHEYHDKFLEKVVMQSELPDILKKHGIDVKKVLQKEKYPLLDSKLPDISVDRWDYFLRDTLMFGLVLKKTILLLSSQLKCDDNLFYFEDTAAAAQTAILFMNACRLIWLDATSHGAYFLLSEALKTALKENYLSQDDLFTTDEEVMNKLKHFKNAQVKKLLQRLHSGKEFHFAPKKSAEFYVPNKPRFIDPLVKVGTKMKRVSDIVPGMKDYFKQFVASHSYLGVIQEK